VQAGRRRCCTTGCCGWSPMPSWTDWSTTPTGSNSRASRSAKPRLRSTLRLLRISRLTSRLSHRRARSAPPNGAPAATLAGRDDHSAPLRPAAALCPPGTALRSRLPPVQNSPQKLDSIRTPLYPLLPSVASLRQLSEYLRNRVRLFSEHLSAFVGIPRRPGPALGRSRRSLDTGLRVPGTTQCHGSHRASRCRRMPSARRLDRRWVAGRGPCRREGRSVP
jgi:hypothetical protein